MNVRSIPSAVLLCIVLVMLAISQCVTVAMAFSHPRQNDQHECVNCALCILVMTGPVDCFADYLPADNIKLEQAYESDQASVGVSTSKHGYKVSLDTYTQTNLKTFTKRKVRRVFVPGRSSKSSLRRSQGGSTFSPAEKIPGKTILTAVQLVKVPSKYSDTFHCQSIGLFIHEVDGLLEQAMDKKEVRILYLSAVVQFDMIVV